MAGHWGWRAEPGMGNLEANSSTSARNAASLGMLVSSTYFLKLVSFLPFSPWLLISTVISTAADRYLPTRLKSSSTSPREVRAGLPRRRPPGTNGLVSPGTEFLLAVMCAFSSTFSTRAPSTPLERRSTRRRWLSVPPVTSRKPWAVRVSPSTRAFLTACFWYATKDGSIASCRATDRAAIAWLWGPPWRDGKTAKLIFSSSLWSTGLPSLPTSSPLR
mmetsp:Transcript_50566/g.127008  ORF Transcript_50566/g.127008 Transcript_50566/m.127008 type:complete len:218 (-) Transcript_50566:859-1512(-)